MEKAKLWPGKHSQIPDPTEIACIWVTKIWLTPVPNGSAKSSSSETWFCPMLLSGKPYR